MEVARTWVNHPERQADTHAYNFTFALELQAEDGLGAPCCYSRTTSERQGREQELMEREGERKRRRNGTMNVE